MFLCLRKNPLQCEQADKVIVFLWEVGGGEDEGLGDRKRKTGSHVLTQ